VRNYSSTQEYEGMKIRIYSGT